MMKKAKNAGASVLKSVFLIALIGGIIVFVLLVIARNSGISSQAGSSNRLLAKVPQRSLVSVNLHLGSGIIPPTNKWFSSLAFQQPSNPVFAWPLALQLNSTGFMLSQPQISAAPDVITAPFTPDITAHVAEEVEQTVTGYDDLSVAFSLDSQKQDQLEGRLTRGSPYLFMTLRPHKTMTLDSNFDLHLTGDGMAIFESKGIRYGVFAGKASALRQSGESLRLTAADTPLQMAIFAIPEGTDSTVYFKAARHPIVKTSVLSEISGSRLRTTYNLETRGHYDTLFGLLPFADKHLPDESLGSFSTLEGQQTVHKEQHFSFDTVVTRPDNQLNLDHLSDAERQKLRQLISHDAADLVFQKDDSYFGGKEVYRAAQLLQLAKQLGMTEPARAIQSKLKAQLATWFNVAAYKNRTAKYFYYDNALKGLVGAKTGFGSEEFNDHNFHYGYFLDAAAILGRYDKGFLRANRDFVNLLAKDIVNIDRGDKDFPYLRTFDGYAGHSWASGLGDFADGQNQESSSEAVQAWYAAYQWAMVTGNTALKNQALGLYARESQAARSQWLSKPPQTEYAHGIVSIVWSGKLDYATFFGTTPDAKLGIELIPMSPGSTYLKAAGASPPSEPLAALDSELAGRPPALFKDYLLMYRAMFDPAGARKALETIAPQDIDGADSMSYLYAWVYSR